MCEEFWVIKEGDELPPKLVEFEKVKAAVTKKFREDYFKEHGRWPEEDGAFVIYVE